LLETALTHRSYGVPNNERLEFVGDGVLNCVIAELLFRRFDNLPEGDLSRLRANLVRQDTLHRIALELDLGLSLHLGDGELKSGGVSRPSILADAVEAIFGAIYIDGGFQDARAVIERLYAPLIESIDLSRDIKDAKTRLQEALQGVKLPLPVYTLEGAAGELHAQDFSVSCSIPKLGIITRAQGSTRRVAEQRAAELALVEWARHDTSRRGGKR
jgi:ribonuclease-3